MSTRSTILYLAFAAILSSTCYFRPVPDDFDRYIYEALVRSRYQSAETIYPIIKHENPRAENSSVLDSPLIYGSSNHFMQSGPHTWMLSRCSAG